MKAKDLSEDQMYALLSRLEDDGYTFKYDDEGELRLVGPPLPVHPDAQNFVKGVSA